MKKQGHPYSQKWKKKGSHRCNHQGCFRWVVEDYCSQHKPKIEAKSNVVSLMVNNPEGNNKYTDKKVLRKNQPEEVITQEMVQQAYREMLIARRECLSKTQIYTFRNRKFNGLDKIDEEFR